MPSPTAHRCDRLVDDYAASAVFASSSSRELPWQAHHQKTLAQPSPAAHGDGPLQYRSMASPRAPHSKSSAAFASGSARFTKVRRAADATPVVAEVPFNAGAMVSTISQAYPEPSGGWAGGRPSAAFASSSKRMHTPYKGAPGPGAYSPTDPRATVSAGALASGRCATFTSTSARRLPFESGGGRGTDLQAPAPTRYETDRAADFRGRGSDMRRAPSQGAAAMGYTSPRFAAGHCRTPGPGAYAVAESDRRTLGSGAASGSARYGVGMPPSTAERRLEFDIRQTPGPGAYQSRRGLGEGGRAASTAAFASRSARMHSKETASPGPLQYADAHYQRGAIKYAAGSAQSARPRLRRSASFESATERFRRQQTCSPGPGAYGSASGIGSPRRNQAISAVFASTSARTDLPRNPMSAITPGAGAYEHSQPSAEELLVRIARHEGWQAGWRRCQWR